MINYNLKLSKNFTLGEVVNSYLANRLNIDNSPTEEDIYKLWIVVNKIAQPIRDYYNKPTFISSGFRCLELNQALGSSDNSQHIKAEALDLEVLGISNYDLSIWVRDNLEFDQLILEKHDLNIPSSGWVHCSYNIFNNRNESLSYLKSDNGSYNYYNGIVTKI